ncbi:uncharacterized protein LOC123556597 isoform X4 [Mercenaria mercenaria]|uniref:uncharacterized protein LOC123556597 isoform X4 n=1 Tax=Mercenaria mercenaria TaxID=6596 RepID=UPI00234F4F1A|nr:uncharacterized protein LOC123556597 isoform X4 [Mercenaria mercenaria]
MNEQGISLDTKDNSDNNDDQVAEDTRKDSVFSPVKSKTQKSNASSAEDDGKHSLPQEVDSDEQEIEKLQRELETLEKDEAKLKKIKQKEELRQKVVRKRDEVKALRGYFYLIYGDTEQSNFEAKRGQVNLRWLSHCEASENIA